jgi:linoleate 10R-lipoxygenase
MPGAGLCPGYTISRAILADAVSLTRGDRYMTVDFTRTSLRSPLFLCGIDSFLHSASNLTSWGYRDCQFNPRDGSYGGMLTKLLFRHLPDHYPVRSAYAHFPFLVPTRMMEDMAKRSDDLVKKYTWTRPGQAKGLVTAVTHAQVSKLLEDTQNFNSIHEKRLASLTDGVVIDHELVGHPMPCFRRSLTPSYEGEICTAQWRQSQQMGGFLLHLG